MSPFTASPLGRQEIGRAFPLVQLLLPSVDRRHWEQFARRFLRQSHRRGIMAVRDHRGHIRGLAIYRNEIDMNGPVLNADPVLFVDLLDASEVALTLIRALEDEARRCGCIELRVNLADAADGRWTLPAGLARFETRRRLTAAVPTGSPPDGNWAVA